MKWILRGKLSERAMQEERGWEEKAQGTVQGAPGRNWSLSLNVMCVPA